MSRNHFLFLLLPIAAGVACSSPTGSTGGTAKVPKILVADAGGNDRIDGFDDIQGANWITLTTTSPSGIALDASDRIYVTDNTNNRIIRMDSISGAGAVLFGTTGTGTGQFSDPVGIFVDGSGMIYVADWGNNRIVRIDDMTGANWTALTVSHPGAVFVDGANRIYVAEYIDDRIDTVRRHERVEPAVLWQPGERGGPVQQPAGLVRRRDRPNLRGRRPQQSRGPHRRHPGHQLGRGPRQQSGWRGHVQRAGRRLGHRRQDLRDLLQVRQVVEMDEDMSGHNWKSLGSRGTGAKQFGQPLGIVAH